MWCACCLKPVLNARDHRECKEQIWWTMSREYTEMKVKMAQQNDEGVPKGATVELKDK